MLEPILQGLIEWLYSLFEDIADYFFGDIMDVLTMDMDYFRKVAPIVDEISEVILALAWALLIGNLVFQLIKSMMSGAGFEGEDPRILFMRTFAFSFLLLASNQICEMCSSITGKVVLLLSIQPTFTMFTPSSAVFAAAGGVNWLIAIIVGIMLIFQMIKLFFDIGERYVISCVLTFMAPLAFAMGASKNTSDIFKGWCRMYGSMNLMLIMNIVFLKLIMSAMANVVNSGIILWVVFVLALTRVARKIDAHIAKIGLNPAQTGNNVGVRFPGGMTMVVVRLLASLVGKSAGNMKSNTGGNNRPSGNHHTFNGNASGNSGGNNRNHTASSGHAGNTNPTPQGEANVNASVNNQSRVTRTNAPSGASAGRQSVNAANANGRYGTQNNSDTKTNTSRETTNRENNKGNAKLNFSPSVNVGYVQSPAPARGTDGRVVSRQTTEGARIHTRDAGRNITNTGDSDRNHTTVNPPLSRNTGTPETSSHFSARTSLDSTSVNRSNHANTPQKADVNISGANGGTPNVTVPAALNVQSRSRIFGSMAGGGTVNRSQIDVSNSNRREVNTVENSSAFHTSNNGGNRCSGANYANTGVNSSGVYSSDHHSTSNSASYFSGGTNIGGTERRIDHEHKFGRYDPAAANRKGQRGYYTKDVSTADSYKRGEENRKATEKRNKESLSRGASRRRHN